MRRASLCLALLIGLLFTPRLASAACPGLGPYVTPIAVSNSGAPITNYFALLTIDTATPIGVGRMRVDGGDVRFHNGACTEFPFWIEGGMNTAFTRIWVKVPSVPSGASGFYMSNGDLTLTHTNAATDIFGATAIGLYTFGAQTGTTVADGIGSRDLSLLGSAAWTPGPRPGIGAVTGLPVGNLRGTDAGVSLGTGSFTVFSAVNPTMPNGSTQGIIGSYNGDATNGWILKFQGGTGQFMLLANGGGDWCQSSGGNVAANAWSLVGARRSAGSVNTLLQNGNPVGDICTGDTRNVDGLGPFELGRGYNSNYPLQGSISLSIIYNSALSDAAVAELYQSLFPPTHPDLLVGQPFGNDVDITSGDNTTFTIGALGSFTFTANGSPAPTFSLSGALPAGVTLDAMSGVLSGTPAIGTAGVYPLTLTGSNGVTYDDTQSFTLTVNRAAQTISFANPGPRVTGTSLTLSATSTSGLPVSFTSSTPTICTVNGASAQFLDAGTCIIIAAQPGDASFLVAPPVTQSIAVALAVPLAPTNVRVSISGNLVVLEWQPASTGTLADAFLVDVGDAPGRTTVATSLTTSNHEQGLLPRGEYFLRVRGVNAAGMGAPSEDVWAVVTASEPVAGVPVGFTGSVNSDTVRLAWQPSTAGAAPEGYLLQVGTDFFNGTLAQLELPASTTSITVPNVPAGTYVARVRALTDLGPTPPSPALWLHVGAAATCATAPNPPTMLTPLISGHTVSMWWWPAASTPASAFFVQAGTASGMSDIATVGLGAMGGLSADVGDGHFFVRAIGQSDCGSSAASTDAELWIGGPTPNPPTGLTLGNGAGGLTLTWTPAATGAAATHYIVEAGLSPGTTIFKFPIGSTPSLTFPVLPSGTTFVARVRGVNASGIGAASAEIVVVVP